MEKSFFRHLLIAAGIVVVLVVGAMIFLNIVTKHNQELSVPDFSNLTIAEAQEMAAQHQMVIEVTDSAFVKRMKRGAVYRQNPAPEARSRAEDVSWLRSMP